MQTGSMENSLIFKPGMNRFSCTGPTVITFTNTVSGEVVSTFVVDTGSHFVRVPQDCVVLIDCEESIKWTNEKGDSLEYLDNTPVEATLIRPLSMQEEMERKVMARVASMLGVSVDDLEPLDDKQDFDIDVEEGQEVPLSMSELKVMALEGQPTSRIIEDDPADPDHVDPALDPDPADVETEEPPPPPPQKPPVKRK